MNKLQLRKLKSQITAIKTKLEKYESLLNKVETAKSKNDKKLGLYLNNFKRLGEGLIKEGCALQDQFGSIPVAIEGVPFNIPMCAVIQNLLKQVAGCNHVSGYVKFFDRILKKSKF